MPKSEAVPSSQPTPAADSSTSSPDLTPVLKPRNRTLSSHGSFHVLTLPGELRNMVYAECLSRSTESATLSRALSRTRTPGRVPIVQDIANLLDAGPQICAELEPYAYARTKVEVVIKEGAAQGLGKIWKIESGDEISGDALFDLLRSVDGFEYLGLVESVWVTVEPCEDEDDDWNAALLEAVREMVAKYCGRGCAGGAAFGHDLAHLKLIEGPQEGRRYSVEWFEIEGNIVGLFD